MTDDEIKKTCYEQNYLQFRSLNNTMWQIPIIAMTLTAGLWLGIDKFSNDTYLQKMLLILNACSNLGLVLILTRVRYVMFQYLLKIKEYYPDGFVDAPGEGFTTRPYLVANVFRLLLILSSIMCLVASLIL